MNLIDALRPDETIALEGRALVTGGTSGIGLAFARALAARGLDLVLVARNPERLAETAQQLHDQYDVDVETLSADLSNAEETAKVARRLSDDAEPVTVLVNNAGHGLHTPLATDQVEIHQHGIDLMVRAVLTLGAAAATAMRRRGAGMIINVGSVAGTLPLGGYSAIKSWVNTYSDALAIELEGTGVHVTGLLPGWVRTEFHERAKIKASAIPDILWLEADRVVEDCLEAAQRGTKRTIPSLRFKLIVGLLEHGPRPLIHEIVRRVNGARR